MPKTLKGYITVEFGINRVYLLHKVHGRFSELEISKGDLIKLESPQIPEVYVTFEQIMTTVVKNRSKFEGCLAEVTINSDTTKELENRNRLFAIKELFVEVEKKLLTHEEASEIVMRWESKYEECELD